MTRSNLANFGKVATYAVDAGVWAQPLIYDSGTLRTLIVATAGGTIYGFNADAAGAQQPLWSVSAGSPFLSGAGSMYGEFGLSGQSGCIATPVIDPAIGVVYAECQLVDGSHKLLAINIVDGTSYHAPVTINATDTASGVRFSSVQSLAIGRAALSLVNGVVYLPYASRGDAGLWYGWVLGFDQHTLAPLYEYCNTCSDKGSGAGIWMSGAGLTYDGTNFFLVGGNGSYDGTGDYGEGLNRLTANLLITDWFTPYNYSTLSAMDFDLDTPAVLFQNKYIIFGGKEGRIMVANKNNLGHLETSVAATPLFQSFPLHAYIHDVYTGLLATDTDLYVGGTGDPISRFHWNGTQFDLTGGDVSGAARSSQQFTFSGAQMAYSWDGTSQSSAILWAIGGVGDRGYAGFSPYPGALYAYDPITLTTLYSSATVAADALGNEPKLSTPTVANGRVYVGTRDNTVVAYGLTHATVTGLSSPTAGGTYGAGKTVSLSVTFDRTVLVTGSPRLTLNSGGTAVYASGSGSATLLFSYVVGVGDSSSLLDVSSAASLVLNGGTIMDASSTTANLDLPVFPSPSSLPSGTALVIDGVVPTVVSFQAIFGSQSYEFVGGTRDRLPWVITGIRAVFSRPITVGNTSSLAGVQASALTGVGTTTLTWTIAPLQCGSFATSLDASGPNALTDSAGNLLANGAAFSRTIRVLSGDVNGDGMVNAADQALATAAMRAPYNPTFDINGDGLVNLSDVTLVRSRIGSSLP